jgi:hypothetical protein
VIIRCTDFCDHPVYANVTELYLFVFLPQLLPNCVGHVPNVSPLEYRQYLPAYDGLIRCVYYSVAADVVTVIV